MIILLSSHFQLICSLFSTLDSRYRLQAVLVYLSCSIRFRHLGPLLQPPEPPTPPHPTASRVCIVGVLETGCKFSASLLLSHSKQINAVGKTEFPDGLADVCGVED